MSKKAYQTDVLDGLFKEVYADRLKNLVPKAALLQKDAPFVSKEKREGNTYHQPVRLTRAHGWTLDTSGEAFPLNSPEPARTQDATVSGSSFLLREVISYDAAAKLQSGKGKERKRAFVAGSSYLIENMTETASFVLETQLLYGQQDLGVINSRTDDSGTSQTFDLTLATFIPALFAGLEKGFVDVYDSTGATKRNTGDLQITAVDVENRTITLEGVESEMDNIAATDLVYLRDTKDAGMLGLRGIVANTGSMFGINGADYSLWTGNTSSAASGALSFAKLMRGLNKPVNRGLMGDVNAYVSPPTWTDCMNDLAALRRYAEKMGGKLSQGSEDISFYGQAGSVTIKPHILMKPSEAMVVPKGKMIRVGASDITFQTPGMGDSFWQHLPDHAGIGTRCYWNQALFLPTPAQCLLINNIVNQS